jgi:hypothetical protein
MIEKLSKYVNSYIRENPDLIKITIFFTYAGLILYLSNYIDIFDDFKEGNYIISEFLIYGVFSLSFLGVLFLINNFISFIILAIFKKMNLYINKIVLIFIILLESIYYIVIYTDLQIFKLMGVHLYSEIVLKAINKKDIENDVSLTNKQFIEYLTKPILHILLIIATFYILKYLIKKINISMFIEKIYLFLAVIIFLSFFSVIYFWVNVYGESLAVPMWSYLNRTNIDANFDTNYGEGFKYEKIKIKNKKNVLIIIAESLRKDVFNEENMPNTFNFIKLHENHLIKSKHNSPGGHFTLTSIISLWYSIASYNYKALFNSKNYKKSLPINIFNKIGYDTSFMTTSYLTPSYSRIREATTVFGKYKRFKEDETMLKYFKKSYKERNKEKPFLNMIFFKATHYSYRFRKEDSKYKPFLLRKDITFHSSKMNKKYKEKLFNRYKNSVLYTDYLINEVLNTLDEHDRKNTIVIFIGDHGEQFWENGYFGHIKPTYTKELIDIPLLFYIPDLQENINVDTSSNTDILVTLLSYITNISFSDIEKYFDGRSLLETQKNYYSLVVSFNFMGLNDTIALVNKYGKILIESNSSNVKDINSFKIKEYLNFDDTKIKNEAQKEGLNNSFNEFKKDYFKYLKIKNKK